MSTKIGLSEAIALYGPYPSDYPQTLAELKEANPETITHKLAKYLRAEAVDVSNRSEAHYINGPKDVLTLLRSGYVLHTWDRHWRSYYLDSDRQPELVAKVNKDGTVKNRAYNVVTTELLPKLDDIPKLAKSAKQTGVQPGWLVIYGGTPDVLTKPGVDKGLEKLVKNRHIFDICFWQAGDPVNDKQPTLWSIKATSGLTTSNLQVDFDQTVLEVVKSIGVHL